MGQKTLIFGEDFINKYAFHKNKIRISIDKVDIERIVLSKKFLYGNKTPFKYLIGYIHIGDVLQIPLCIKLPQMNGYVKYFDNNNKYINLIIYDKELLQKYNEVWDKISNLLKKGFYSEPVYNDKYIKTKIKIYNNKINTHFQGNEVPKDNEYCTYLFVILLDSVVKTDNYYYYPQIFLEESKYAIKKKKIMNTINEKLKLNESDDDKFDEY